MRTLLLALVAATLAAQPVDRNRPPDTPSVRAWKLAPVFETTLPNGLTVVLVEDNRVPMVTMRLVFPCGSRRDPKELPGVASAVAEMLMQGTAGRTGSQIIESVDEIGGSMSAAAGSDQIALSGNTVAESLPEFLEIASDVVRNASFPELELKVFRQNRRQVVARQRAQPAYAASEAFRAIIFGDHPYSRLAPNPAALDQLTQKALEDYRDKFLTPNNAYLILVGKLPARAQAMKVVSDQFSSWQRKPVVEIADPAPPAAKRRLILIDRPGALQTSIQIGMLAAMQRDEDYFPAVVSDAMLSPELPADARAEPSGLDEAGIFAIAMQEKTEAAGDALQAMIGRLGRMATALPTAQELTDAKTAASSAFLLRLESQAGLAENLALLKVLHLPAAYIESYTARIEAVQPDEVRQATTKYLTPDNDTIVVVGDASKLQPQLQKIGTFEVFRAK